MELPDIGRRGCKLQLSSDTSRYAGTSLEVHDSPCHSGFLRLGLRQPLDRQACRNGECVQDLMQTVVMPLSSLPTYGKIGANEVRILPKWSVGMKICVERYRYLPIGITWDGFSHSFLTDSGSVNCKRAIHYQDMEISTLATFQAL
jgi:hypothetical protein